MKKTLQTRLYKTVSNKKRNPPTAPGQVVGLIAVGGDTVVNLSWTSTSKATSYTVYKATSQNGTYTQVQNNIGTNQYQVTGLTNGTIYWFKVKAVNSIGSGPLSSPASATPSGSAPGKVTNLVVTPGNTANGLAWTAVATATGYNIKRYTVTGGPYTTIKANNAGTTYNNIGLTNGVQYFYVVSAINASGEGPNSDEANGTPVSAVSFGLNTLSASSTNVAQCLIAMQAAADAGYTSVRVAIAMDGRGNTARPFLADANIISVVNKACDLNIWVIFDCGSNPSLSGTHVLSLNSGVAWTVQTRPPSTVWAWCAQCVSDVYSTADTACVAKGKTTADVVEFILWNEYGKGGVNAPTLIDNTYGSPYSGYDYGYWEPAFFTMAASIVGAISIGACKLTTFNLEGAEVDTGSNGTLDCDVEIASMTGADFDTCIAAATYFSTNCYAKKISSPYVKATFQSDFLAKTHRQYVRMATVSALPKKINEFGVKTSNGPGAGVDVQTCRNDQIAGMKTQTDFVECVLFCANTKGSTDDTNNYYILNNDGSFLRSITVAP